MATFKRPGSIAPTAFGLSFDTDREDSRTSSSYVAPEAVTAHAQRRSLPISKHRREILYLVETHATTIIVGETGSGKTTQLPQYLLEAGWCDTGQVIACTQPRRVAAMTVASRVAEERGCRLGQEVGYAIRFEDVHTPGVTKIKYCTDGVLLNEMLQDPLLHKYSVVMVDEAHERSLATDVLLGLLKKVQRRRRDLRLIISSATLEAETLAAFFNTSRSRSVKPKLGAVSQQPAILSVEGRTHVVQVHYLEHAVSSYVTAAVQCVVDIHMEDLPGDCLIFLTGQEDCESCVRMLEEEARRLRKSRLSSRLMSVPLYAGLPAVDQLAAFQPTPRGYRKVVVSTNIAETSVTLEGIVYVIDCMFAKIKCYNPLSGLESLVAAPISKASAMQRAGRAGRVRPGHCFRLGTEEEYEKLPAVTVPEMQRSSLSGVVLQLKALGVDNIMTFEWLSPPPAETMVRALELLRALEALDDDARLSDPTGQQMSELSVEPQLAKCLLASAQLQCSEEVLTIVALLSVQSVWRGPAGDRRGYDEARDRFAVGEGDLVTYLNIWRGWQESGRSSKWCTANFLHHRSLLRANDIRSQLNNRLRRFGLPLVSCERDIMAVRKAMCAGLMLNAVQLVDSTTNVADPDDYGTNVYHLIRTTGQSPKLRMHPSSVLWRCRPTCCVFFSAQQNNSGWFEMQDVMTIEPEWLPELAPDVFQYTHKGRAA